VSYNSEEYGTEDESENLFGNRITSTTLAKQNHLADSRSIPVILLA
jgi:hypothetical protein